VKSILDEVIEIAKKVGQVQLEGLNEKRIIHYKGEIDLVTEVDKKCEKILVDFIKSKFPHHDIITEESQSELRGSSYCWFIDPLDGTTNYAHGYPVFCVSIALQVEGEVVLGVVYDPTRDELFWAQRGEGAYLNGRKIKVSDVRKLSESLLATGFPYDLKRDPVNNLDHFANMILEAQAIRRDGSAALNLCYVASGRFDGFWELKLKPWDVAAGALIVKEAGGVVSDFDGNPFDLSHLEVVASNGHIHDQMLSVLKRGKRPTTESKRFPR
jgi:myo-inositol-1(or 4)-monophosphatase